MAEGIGKKIIVVRGQEIRELDYRMKKDYEAEKFRQKEICEESLRNTGMNEKEYKYSMKKKMTAV